MDNSLPTSLKVAATGVIVAAALAVVPSLLKQCPTFSGPEGLAGPPGYACIGGTFVTQWLTVPAGLALIAGASAGVAALWRQR